MHVCTQRFLKTGKFGPGTKKWGFKMAKGEHKPNHAIYEMIAEKICPVMQMKL